MDIATIRTPVGEQATLVHTTRGVAILSEIMPDPPSDAMQLLDEAAYAAAVDAVDCAADGTFHRPGSLAYAPPYRSPRKVWGIGLNYVAHAGDLSAPLPEEPASFIKADHTIVGPGDTIELPVQSERVTAEAELGLIIGRLCRNVTEADALNYVWGVCPILDQTAEDILQRNPRFLTRAKNFPTFFSFGESITPLQEVIKAFGSLDRLEVSTVKNGEAHRTNSVANMTYSPAQLVSFHSAVMPLFPGDIISTGTPGAVVIKDGDVVECRIPGLGTLVNNVRRPS